MVSTATHPAPWRPRLTRRSFGLGLGAWLSGCAAPQADGNRPASRTAGWGAPAAEPLHPVVADACWLGRISHGAAPASLARLRALGRARYLDEQLAWPLADPPALAALLAPLPLSQASDQQRMRAARQEQQRITTLAGEEDKQAARMALNAQAAAAWQETQGRHLLRALHSPAQLRELMTGFWMNHFSVHANKASLRWTLADYEDKAVRPRALGRFEDLLLATVTSPAMLEYLDNAQSAAGRLNENYARELLELHTLGISGGPSGSTYTQQDVQELARVLTGLGLNVAGEPPKLPAHRQPQYLARGLFEFNPARHDFGPKVLLGRSIAPVGFGEVEQAVALLAGEPATARFISAKLAAWFVADPPPPGLVEKAAQTFTRTQGDLAAVLRVLLLSPEMAAAVQAPAGARFKEPLLYVTSTVRLAYPERLVTNPRPLINWLSQLGQPLYGRASPDGYPTHEAAWASSGQMIKRFEFARNIGSGNGNLFTPFQPYPPPASPQGAARQAMMATAPAAPAVPEATAPPAVGPPALKSAFFEQTLAPTLGPATQAALAQAAGPAEWNALLLSSPEWMQR